MATSDNNYNVKTCKINKPKQVRHNAKTLEIIIVIILNLLLSLHHQLLLGKAWVANRLYIFALTGSHTLNTKPHPRRPRIFFILFNTHSFAVLNGSLN